MSAKQNHRGVEGLGEELEREKGEREGREKGERREREGREKGERREREGREKGGGREGEFSQGP